MKTSGLVHLYCGDGKGKTTAAVGLAVRHAGHGGKVVFAQFLKDGSSGECRVLAKLGVTVLAANPAGKFTFRMTDEEKAETAAALVRTFDAAAGYAVREGATGRDAARARRGMRGSKRRLSARKDGDGLSRKPSGHARGRAHRPQPVGGTDGARGLYHGNAETAAPI